MTQKIITLSSLLVITSCTFTQEPATVVDAYGSFSDRQVTVENLRWEEENLPEMKSTQSSRKAVVTYTVQQGDSMHIIARKFNVPVEKIVDKNGLPSADFLSIGQELTIPQEEYDTVTGGRYSLTRSRFEKNIEVQKAEEPVLAEVEQKPAARVVQRHAVQPGETLYRIGQQYGVTPIDLMMYNSIDKPQDLRAGMLLSIPSESETTTVTAAEKAAAKVLHDAPLKPKVNRVVTSYKKGMIWPVKGKIIRSFGEKGEGINHMGINIEVDANTPILAAEDGTVIYSDDGLESYGNLILVRHKNGYVTAYAHNAKNLAGKNQKVAKGEVIAMAGNTGNVDRPQLHFEVRRNAQAVNPLKVLPR
jgi:murein DD-endopeptidase MepM/ murein hydrolase activator NlpD